MTSATLSAIAGSLLSPLREVSLEKLIGFLWDYLSSSPSPSSPGEAEKQQQLKDSLEALEDAKLTVRSLQSRIMKLFKKHKQNERVVGLHNKLKNVGYDIQDLESEMKYMQLERKVHEINKAEEEAASAADNTSSRFSLKRSFPFGLPSVSFSKKKRRLPTSSQSSSLSTDEDIVRQVTSILKQIQIIESKLKEETMLEDLFDQLKLNGVYDAREYHFTQNERVTTSSTNERKMYGRDDEIQRLIEFLKEPNVNGNVCVAPIVGMGGMGKTTLAQFVFNHEEIEDHFNNKAWICVSDCFDRFRITKEMVDSFLSSTVPCCSNTSLDLLERELRRHLRGKKFLLVLDDIWSDEWQQLLSPLQSAQAQSIKIKIIVTCRDPTVLRSIDQGNIMNLEGIDDEEYWSLFLNCTFGENNPENYSHELHDIGKLIVEKLMGSPLAAKTVGKLLECSLTKKHWKDVLENDLWTLKTNAHDIMPALALSYYHLPQHLQQCFVFCSVFPKDHFYCKDELICMWIANGYIHESGSSSKTMNDIGEDYYYELVAMCFFDACEDQGSSRIIMHDLIHDLAKLVSHKETYIYESGKDKEISKNVRHLYTECSIDQGLVCETNYLRTFVLESAKDMSAILNHGAFNRIRVLVISDANMQEFPNAIPRLKHLQYLDLWKTQIRSIPDSLCELYLLRVLALPHPPQTLPSRFHSLINLEILCMGHEFDILEYYVNKEMGFTVAQLRNMNELRTRLSIKGLQNIDNREEAMKAKLKKKHHIKSLSLWWNIYTVDDDCKHDAKEVLEGLQPHPNLEELLFYRYMGCNMPNWLKTLQKLKKIELACYRKCLLAALGLSPSLEELHFFEGENITIECESCDDSESEMFPSLQLLSLMYTTVSFTGIPTSSSSSSSPATPLRRKVFPRLQKLTMYKCNEMNGFPWPICIALKKLDINHSPCMDDKLPGCLRGLSSLTELTLTGAKIKNFDAEVMATLHALCRLDLSNCDELLSLEGLQALSSLQHLLISSCPKFRFCTAEMAKLRKLNIEFCHDLESLPTWLHRLSSLKELTIVHCLKLLSLPEGGLPSSLERLEIRDCHPCFMQRCQQEGSPEWLMIQHIPKHQIIFPENKWRLIERIQETCHKLLYHSDTISFIL